VFSVRIATFSTPGTVSANSQMMFEVQDDSGAMRKMYFCLSPVIVSFQVSAKTTGMPRSFATSFDATPTEL
jgi:hypothetical protein